MKASDWISVEDRLPKIGERVMGCQQFNDACDRYRKILRETEGNWEERKRRINEFRCGL